MSLGWNLLRLIAYKAISQGYGNEDDLRIDLDLRTQPLKSEFPVLRARCVQENRILGIRSDSFHTPGVGKEGGITHNLLMEWDEKSPSVDWVYQEVSRLHAVKAPFLVETAKGYHIIGEADLSIEKLVSLQKGFGCCPGFILNTEKRGFATLRVGTKPGSYLYVLEDSDPCMLRTAYRTLLWHEQEATGSDTIEGRVSAVLRSL